MLPSRRLATKTQAAFFALAGRWMVSVTSYKSKPADSYPSFIERKSHLGNQHGFDPGELPDFLFDFQKSLVTWAIRQGRGALFADCGLGKTPMQLVWADRIVKHTNRPVLIMTPLAVASQTVREANKFGIDAKRSPTGELFGQTIHVANYERLHYFNPTDFAGVVCDESSILKSFSGATRKQINRFMTKMPYRLLCTATASPNDYIELGTSSEALGELSHSEMLRRFFAQLDDKGQQRDLRKQEEAEKIIASSPKYFKKLAFRVSQTIGQYRLRHHAVEHFWRWVASWARACRKPSDLGFSDEGFSLPALIERDHVISPREPTPEHLFNMPAFGMHEERQERRRTIVERTEYVARLVDHNEPAVVWCHTNDEADSLCDSIKDAEQVAGRTPDDRKVEIYDSFAKGSLRVLVIKPKIGAWGLNWQHCNHVVTYPSHSYEQYYQSVRRCWRFGQKKPVTLDVVATDGEVRVLDNMRAKARKMDVMFESLVREMNRSTRIERENIYTNEMRMPSWA